MIEPSWSAHRGSPEPPAPRGPVSEAILAALRKPPGRVGLPRLDAVDMLDDDDGQLALTCCYELHYRGFAGVDPAWEWAPALLDVRSRLEHRFEARLADEVPVSTRAGRADVREALLELASGDDDGSLSCWMLEHGTRREMREFLVHRSVYQLKEADPHTWALPRVRGGAKAAMAQIQYDEYGAGDPGEVHAELFSTTMRSLGLDPAYGAYLDLVPGPTLATVNVVSLFGLHRRWRAACVGHLALFEMTSVGPMDRYARALARLGVAPPGRRFYDVHVVADTVHETVALDAMVPALLEEEPRLAPDVIFGARAATLLEQRFSRRLLGAWGRTRTSLRRPLPSENGCHERAAARTAV